MVDVDVVNTRGMGVMIMIRVMEVGAGNMKVSGKEHRVEEVQHTGQELVEGMAMKAGESFSMAREDGSKEVVATGVDRIEQVQHPGRELLLVMCGEDLISVKTTTGVDREDKEDLAESSIGTSHKMLN